MANENIPSTTTIFITLQHHNLHHTSTPQMQSISTTVQSLKNLPLPQQLSTISKLKSQFIEFESFLLDESFIQNHVSNGMVQDKHRQEILIVREAMETIIMGIAQQFHTLDPEQGFKIFEQNYSQLNRYYKRDFANVPKSQRQNLIVGLRLLSLLAQNMTSKFHSELELLPFDLRQDMYIRHPIELEMYLMEGSYNKLRTVIEKVPATEYTPLMEYLIKNSVRTEIASCIEKAYEHLKLSSAQKLLIFKSLSETEHYIKENTTWTMDGSMIYFQQDHKVKPFREEAKNLIERTLEYAEEANRIV